WFSALCLISLRSPSYSLFPYTTLFRSYLIKLSIKQANYPGQKGRISALITGILAALFTLIMGISAGINYVTIAFIAYVIGIPLLDRKSTRLNSSHVSISYAVFCLIQIT